MLPSTSWRLLAQPSRSRTLFSTKIDFSSINSCVLNHMCHLQILDACCRAYEHLCSPPAAQHLLPDTHNSGGGN